ncbi:hypothetical protein [Apilactobacillus kunkeei]|uniref:hypothetical protein n=1 Tax=Apilactobacillus kunkeei TaxID=148814 RepID=UPI001783A188|nr:hypothetical protein [Apilactobacillus kunkeei]
MTLMIVIVKIILEVVILDLNILYNYSGDKIKHLSKEDIKSLMDEYYSGNYKVKDIISKYNLDVLPTKLFKEFPLVKLDKKCDYDGVNLIAPLNSKSLDIDSVGMVSLGESYCPTCKHKPYDEHCECENCLLKREKDNMQKFNAVVAVSFSQGSISITEVDLKDRLLLGAYLRGFLNEDMEYINSLDEVDSKIIPKTDDAENSDYQIVNDFKQKKYININIESSLDAFIFEREEDHYLIKSYYPALARYSINIRDKNDFEIKTIDREMLTSLMYPDRKIFLSDVNFCFDLWRNISLLECKEYLINELQKVGFTSFVPGDKTNAVILHLLDNFSAAEITGFIHNKVTNAVRYYSESNISKKHAANTVISNLETVGEKAIANNWDVTKYHRDYNLKISELSKMFFNYVLEIADEGFNEAPNKEVIEDKLNQCM